jgi:hypothetical protein
MIALKRFLARLLNFLAQHFAKQHCATPPLTPTLSRIRAMGLKPSLIGALVHNKTFFRLPVGGVKPRALANIPSPASGRGCATAWERGGFPIAKKANHAK